MRRRSIIKIAGTASTVGLAGLSGCLGGNGDDGSGGSDIRLQTSSEDTIQYAMSQGVASVVNQNTDEIYLDARPSSGDLENIRNLNEGDADIGSASLAMIHDAVEREGPYEDVTAEYQAVCHWYTTNGIFMTTDPDIEYLTDIQPDTNLWVGNVASAFGEAMIITLDSAVGEDNYNWVETGYGEQASAISEGRIDVGVAGVMNFEDITAWSQEALSTNDMHVIDLPEDVAEEADQHEAVAIEELDVSQFDGWASDPPETILHVATPYTLLTTDEADSDAIYELLSVMHEYSDGLADAHATLRAFQDGNHFVNHIPDQWVDLHEGAQRFIDDHDIDY